MSEFDEKYNVRQHEKMLQMIQLYQRGLIGLSQLIDALDALGGTLQNKSESWLSEFEPAWGVLEDVHSVMLDEGRADFDEDDRKLIKDALARLTSAIQTQIAAPDKNILTEDEKSK